MLAATGRRLITRAVVPYLCTFLRIVRVLGHIVYPRVRVRGEGSTEGPRLPRPPPPAPGLICMKIIPRFRASPLAVPHRPTRPRLPGSEGPQAICGSAVVCGGSWARPRPAPDFGCQVCLGVKQKFGPVAIKKKGRMPVSRAPAKARRRRPRGSRRAVEAEEAEEDGDTQKMALVAERQGFVSRILERECQQASLAETWQRRSAARFGCACHGGFQQFAGQLEFEASLHYSEWRRGSCYSPRCRALLRRPTAACSAQPPAQSAASPRCSQ